MTAISSKISSNALGSRLLLTADREDLCDKMPLYIMRQLMNAITENSVKQFKIPEIYVT